MLQRDLTTTLTRELRGASKSGKIPVNVTVDVRSVSFESVLPGPLRSSAQPYSTILANVTIRDANSGKVILSEKPISGNDNLGAHNLVSATKVVLSLGKAPGKVYHDLVAGFSADLRSQLFEWQGLMTAVN